jgi:hypothetical protein
MIMSCCPRLFVDRHPWTSIMKVYLAWGVINLFPLHRRDT